MTLTRRQWVLLGLLTLLWGLNWPMMKFALREVSPLYFRALTMSGGTLTLIAFFTLRGVALGASAAQAGRLAWLALPNIIGWPASWPSRCRSGPCSSRCCCSANA